MDRHFLIPLWFAILSALTFGISAPLSKILLTDVDPIMLSVLFMIGSGVGMSITILAMKCVGIKRKNMEAELTRKDFKGFAGSIIFGSVIPTILLITSLNLTHAATAAVLLSFEGTATTIIAWSIYHEPVNKRIILSLGCITLACIILSFEPGDEFGLSIGALGVLSACISWGISNNMVREISHVDPITLMNLKSWIAGIFFCILAFSAGDKLPSFTTGVFAMIVGFTAYGGLTGIFFIKAVRELGSARAGSIFSINPIFGVILSVIIWHELPGFSFLIALPLVIIGTIIMITEKHEHEHVHYPITHEHRHRHDDLHHNHEHNTSDPKIEKSGYHSHMHTHSYIIHTHQHFPDIHHRHEHNNK